MYIDWNSPIEAIGPDGNVVPMRFTGERGTDGSYIAKAEPKVSGSIFWTAYGRNADSQCRWHLRNTLQYPAAKPSTPSNEELTQRMEKLVAELASCDPKDFSLSLLVSQARSIVSELPKLASPIDLDLVAAREQEAKAAEANGFHEYAAAVRDGQQDDGPVRQRHEGIKLGRTLAAGGTAHE